MRRFCAFLFVSVIAAGQARPITAPLAFEDTGVSTYLCRGDGFSATLAADRIVLHSHEHDLAVTLAGGNAGARGVARDALPGRSNYYIGADPAQWRTDVANYGRVEYRAVYPGIDVAYYGNARRLEHDFIVAPGADPRAIRMSVDAQAMHISSDGTLVMEWQGREIRWPRPLVYQDQQKIRAGFVLRADKEIGFAVGAYDRRKPLIIDPVLTVSFATYFGGNADESGTVALGPDGSPYMAGSSLSASNPFFGTSNIYVAKYSVDGSKLIYSTSIGGSAANFGSALAIDSAGAAYLTGQTSSLDFPKVNAFQTQFLQGLNYVVVLKLDSAGKLVYSSPFGGGGVDSGNAIAVDAAGSAYVGGLAGENFPVVGGLPGPPIGSSFVAKLAPDGGHLIFCTRLGGRSASEFLEGLAVDASKNIYVTGSTGSTDFPLKNPYQSKFSGSGTAFVTKLDSSGASLIYSTFLGGSSGDGATAIAVDSAGSAYVVGATSSTDFPTVNAFQGLKAVSAFFITPFVAKLSPDGMSLVYSTFIGGVGSAYGIAVDAAGNAYFSGWGNSPTLGPLPPSFSDDPGGVFVSALNAAGDGLLFSTPIGESSTGIASSVAVDASGNVYVAGSTSSLGIATPGAVQNTFGGSTDAFLLKFKLTPGGAPMPGVTQLSPASGNIYTGVTVQVTGQSFTPASTVQWNGVTKSSTYVSATQLTMTVSSFDVVTPGANWINVITAGNISRYLPFTVIGSVTPQLQTISQMQFTAGQGPATLVVSGAGFTAASVVLWNGSAVPTTYVSAAQLNATIVAANLAAVGSATITVMSPPPGGGTSAPITVSILAAPVITAGRVLNAASYTPQVAAGGIVSLFGSNFYAAGGANGASLPTSLQGLSLLVNGVAAPLFYVGAQQINFQMPWQVAGQSSVSLVVSTDAISSAPLAFALAPYAPAIFTMNQQGTGQGSILIAGTSGLAAGAAGRAVKAGETVEIYMTGLGAVANPPASGARAGATSTTLATPSATIGGVNATVTYSGLAPLLIGLYQVNVVVPAGITVGASTPVVVTINGLPSNTVTIATQ